MDLARNWLRSSGTADCLKCVLLAAAAGCNTTMRGIRSRSWIVTLLRLSDLDSLAPMTTAVVGTMPTTSVIKTTAMMHFIFLSLSRHRE